MFEESSAEQIVREFLIPNFAADLNGKIRTIAAKGANDLEPKFNDIHRLFLFTHLTPAYKKRVWVVADGDETGIEVINKMRLKFSGWSKEHFINLNENDFEKYYPQRFQKKVELIFELKKSNLKKYRLEKESLTKEVLAFIEKDKDKAINEFKISSKEVIEILRGINSKL